MCQAIQDFDVQHKESVNMRVGVHTGDILCGIVGSRRFKFDVFSNDVTLANMMESSGFPGRVHISEPTRVFLNDQYELENGPDVQGVLSALFSLFSLLLFLLVFLLLSYRSYFVYLIADLMNEMADCAAYFPVCPLHTPFTQFASFSIILCPLGLSV